MIKFFLFFSFVISINKSLGQTTYFSEDFNNGQTQGFLANGYNGWSVTSIGLNGGNANEWFITCAENGNTTGTCGTGCGNDATLHIGCTFPLNDLGASYFAGGFGNCTTEKRAESPVIDLTCALNPITISFRYIENGETTNDNFTLDYFDGITWTQIDDPAKTINNCGGQGRWTLYSFLLPASAAANPNVKVGFHWVNNNNSIGTDPSVAIDSLRITTPQILLNADFTINPSANPCIGDCINFSDQSTGNINSWNWNFGGGGSPNSFNGQNPPTICWNTAGVYNATLTVTDNCGNSGTQIQQISVTNCGGPLTANFSTPITNICSGTCINFNNLTSGTGGNPISYSWTFQGATPINSFNQNPTNICYNSVGSFSVTLTVDDGTTINTLTLPAYITVTTCNGPTAAFSATPNSGCVNDCFTFLDQSVAASNWNWSFPGGTPNSYIGQNPPQICYSATGVYDVAQYVADANGNTDTLIQPGYITISNCVLPIAGFSSSSTSGCVNSCFTFTDQSQNATTWGWGFLGGTPNFFIGQNPQQICYSTAGVYDVAQYVADANGNTDTLIQTGYITISNCPPPVAGFSSLITTGCENDCFTFTDQSQNATTWGWGFPGGTPNIFIGQNPPQICYAAAGTYDVVQYVADANGNTDTLIQVGFITINNCTGPTAAFNPSTTTGCNNDSITFTDASLNATSWSWIFIGGTPSTFIGQNPPPIHYQTPGVYDVLLVVTNSNGVDSLLQPAFITINYCGGLLAQFAASDTFICAGECISFADLSFGNPIGWMWILPGATPDTVTAQSPPYVCYLNAGIFPVTLIAFDSTTADTVTYTNYITVMNGTPVSTNLDSATIFAGTTIQLIATGGINYSWNNGFTLDDDSISSPIATPYDTTNYIVTMYDANGCSSTKSILINVIPPETVWAPTAFTPNNDKNNDIFYIKPGGIIINYELRIFDRWGEMLFQSKDPTAGWDGTYLNTKLNVGVYVYYYKIEFIDGAILENSGDVTLLR
ncbi:MAG: PKD domain-containing protein [Bacteroidota bacterium]